MLGGTPAVIKETGEVHPPLTLTQSAIGCGAVLGRLWAALGLTGVYSGCVMIGEPPLLVSGLASKYFRIRALLSTPDFGLRDRP